MQPNASSLRLAGVAISHFRTFRGRTRLALRSAGKEGVADPIVVLRGDNGSGKSSALSAIELFFRGAVFCLASAPAANGDGEARVPWDLLSSAGHRDITLHLRDRPADHDGPTEIEACFAEPELGALRLRIATRGAGAELRLEQDLGKGYGRVPPRDAAALLALFETPYGPGSRPVAILTARRRALWLPDEPGAQLLPAGLATQLFRLRTSLAPGDRQRWRSFADLLSRFAPFAGKDISIERLGQGPPQLLVEERGQAVVPLAELSAGEQQVVVLAAALLFSRAAIVCVENPELGLDQKTWGALLEIFDGYVRAGFVDQLLLESQGPPLPGLSALRFRRASGEATQVERLADDASEVGGELGRRAREASAAERAPPAPGLRSRAPHAESR